jgi:hypothetical protein
MRRRMSSGSDHVEENMTAAEAPKKPRSRVGNCLIHLRLLPRWAIELDASAGEPVDNERSDAIRKAAGWSRTLPRLRASEH